MNKGRSSPAPITVIDSLKKSYALLSLLLFIIIAVNVIGYFFIVRLNSQREQIQTTANMIHEQKTAYTLFVSASSNSVIGLATSNWSILLDERKIIAQQIENFEALGAKIKIAQSDFRNKAILDNYYKEISNQWQDLKRQNVTILRTKNTALEKNETIFQFIVSTKSLQGVYEKYESEVFKILTERQIALVSLTQYVYYLNFTFQLLAIPFLIFVMFIPGLKHAQELELARVQNITLGKLSSLGEMAGNIAHEINTPLTAILLKAELIERKNSKLEKPSSDISILASSIIEIISRIDKIIKGLKSYSRDAKDDAHEFFSIRHLINSTLDICGEKFRINNIKITIHEDQIDAQIKTKLIQVSQCLLNLLNNSFDAVVKLDEKWIELVVTIKDNNLELRVIDSGDKIPEKIIQKIFQPFYTTKSIGSGTGLGLSISRTILMNLGGNLYYDEKNSHTCFVIQLPYNEYTEEV